MISRTMSGLLPQGWSHENHHRTGRIRVLFHGDLDHGGSAMKTIYEAAQVIGAKKTSLAHALGISPSTLYRRQVAEHGPGRLEIGGGDTRTVDFINGTSLFEDAEKLLLRNNIDPEVLRS
jgi:hypothetical protein